MDKDSLLNSPTTLNSDDYTASQKIRFKELIEHDKKSLIGGSTLNLNEDDKSSLIFDPEHMKRLNENDLFMELIKDVSNELDINILCHKILRNVNILTHSDRGSLFLTKGTQTNKLLVSTLYDVTADSTLTQATHTREEAIVIPWGKGIAGHVAATKEPINIKNAYEDSRFNPDVDKMTGYRTYAILCMPIENYEGEVVGVAQIINKRSGTQEFTERDQEVFRKYLMFCGIGIQNARLFEISIQEYKRNKLLLKLARNIFEQQNTLDQLVPKIMRDTQEIMKADCCIYIIHKDFNANLPMERSLCLPHQNSMSSYLAQIQFSPVFKLFNAEDGNSEIRKLKPDEFQDLPETQIALYVVVNGETLLIRDGKCETVDINSIINPPVGDDEMTREDAPMNQAAQNKTVNNNGEKRDTTPQGLATVKSFPPNILTVPIMNNDNIVFGAVQFIHNNGEGQFEDSDVALIEAFALFCGLGINNTSMYENVVKLIAKQNVALEVLSYHASASPEEVKKLKARDIPSVRVLHLDNFSFDDKNFSDDETVLASLSMLYHLNLPAKFNIPLEILIRWSLSVRKNYRNVTYHNWRHAFNVAQVMFCILTTGGLSRHFNDLEVFSFLVACLCHDLDHRGTNNAFMSKADTALAKVYGTSTLEHHHFDQCVMILNSPGNTILQSLSPTEYRRCIELLEHYILATDLAIYFKRRPAFIELVNKGEKEFIDPEEHALLSAMMMTACDIAAITKPWPVQQRIGILVAKEFFEQGDIEKKKLHMQPLPLMDRDKAAEMPRMQVEFINVVCLPVYEALAKLEPRLQPLLDGVVDNRNKWQQLGADPNFDINSFKTDPEHEATAFLYNDPKAVTRGSLIMGENPEEMAKHPRGIKRESIRKLHTGSTSSLHSLQSIQSQGTMNSSSPHTRSPLATNQPSTQRQLMTDVSPRGDGNVKEEREDEDIQPTDSALNDTERSNRPPKLSQISRENTSFISHHSLDNDSRNPSIQRLSSDEENEAQDQRIRELQTRLLARQSSPGSSHIDSRMNPISFKPVSNNNTFHGEKRDRVESSMTHNPDNTTEPKGINNERIGIFRRLEKSQPAPESYASSKHHPSKNGKKAQFSNTPPLTMIYPGSNDEITNTPTTHTVVLDRSPGDGEVQNAETSKFQFDRPGEVLEDANDSPTLPISPSKSSRLMRRDSLQVYKTHHNRKHSQNPQVQDTAYMKNDNALNEPNDSMPNQDTNLSSPESIKFSNHLMNSSIPTDHQDSKPRSASPKSIKFSSLLNNPTSAEGLNKNFEETEQNNGGEYKSDNENEPLNGNNYPDLAPSAVNNQMDEESSAYLYGKPAKYVNRVLPTYYKQPSTNASSRNKATAAGHAPFLRNVSRQSLPIHNLSSNNNTTTTTSSTSQRLNLAYYDNPSSRQSDSQQIDNQNSDEDKEDVENSFANNFVGGRNARRSLPLPPELQMFQRKKKDRHRSRIESLDILSNQENEKVLDRVMAVGEGLDNGTNSRRGTLTQMTKADDKEVSPNPVADRPDVPSQNDNVDLTKTPSFEDQRIELGGRRQSLESGKSLTPNNINVDKSGPNVSQVKSDTLNRDERDLNEDSSQPTQLLDKELLSKLGLPNLKKDYDDPEPLTNINPEQETTRDNIEQKPPIPPRLSSHSILASELIPSQEEKAKRYENDDYDSHKLRRSSRSSLFNRSSQHHKKSELGPSGLNVTTSTSSPLLPGGKSNDQEISENRAERIRSSIENPSFSKPHHHPSKTTPSTSNADLPSSSSKKGSRILSGRASNSSKTIKLAKPPPGKGVARKNQVEDISNNATTSRNSVLAGKNNSVGITAAGEPVDDAQEVPGGSAGSKVHFESLVYKPRNPPVSPVEKLNRKANSKICSII